MKTKLLLFTLLISLSSFAYDAKNITDEDSTGLPGDNFSLEGALEMFRLSASPEDFEKRLNTEDNNVNNLDLNGDDKIDYIRVVGHKENNAHAMVLQVAVNETEMQDVAVIEIEKTGDTTANLQILGDEELYGENVIAEPFEENGVNDKKGKGPSSFDHSSIRIVVNVWRWPSVRFLYTPRYVVWVSPWKYGLYPGWWKPWRPAPWRVYHHRALHFRTGFHFVPRHRVLAAHKVYVPHRKTSVVVVNRHRAARANHKIHRANRMQPQKPGAPQRQGPGRGVKKAPGVKKGRR